MADFTTPSFLEGHSTDEVHQKMIDILPDDLDVSEGSHLWNMTRPTALVISEICEFILPEVVRLILPDWSYDEYLDAHAKTRNLTRRSAKIATGTITIEGEEETVIPAGSVFSTSATNDTSAVLFEATETATIPESGTVNVAVECTEAGTAGNVPAGRIIFNASDLAGITGITNSDPTTGGTDEETDESLRERISYQDKNISASFVGSVADYKRWAESVENVGTATPIGAADTSGTVRIIVTDTNGNPASQALCQAVYNYIMRPDDDESRLAPVNAVLSVEPPATISFYLSATIELKSGYTLVGVRDALTSKITAYMPTAAEEQEIKYSRIAAILSFCEGVNDFSTLKIGTTASTIGTSNLTLPTDKLPIVTADNITLTSGTV